MVAINLDKDPMLADCIFVQIDSSSLIFMEARSDTYNNRLFYMISCSLNGSELKLSCSQEVYNKAQQLKQGDKVSLAIAVNLRYKKLKIANIA